MTQSPKILPALANWGEEEEMIARYIRQTVTNGSIRILEAGCGQKWDQAELLQGIDYSLTGVDLDKAALERRQNILKDLDEAIHGDLSEVSFDNETFEVIFSSFVLEHLSNANEVMENFVKWLKPNGIIVLRIPDPQGVYGFASKVLPFQLHLLYSKYIVGKENPGKNGNAPYPVFYDEVVSRKGIFQFCQSHSLSIKEELCDAYFHKLTKRPYPVISKVSKLVSGVSLGYLKSHRNLLYILQKN